MNPMNPLGGAAGQVVAALRRQNPGMGMPQSRPMGPSPKNMMPPPPGAVNRPTPDIMAGGQPLRTGSPKNQGQKSIPTNPGMFG